MEASDYLDLSYTNHASLFEEGEPVWTALSKIADYLDSQLDGSIVHGIVDEKAIIGERVFIADGAVVEANATIKGPAWIGAGTVIRSGAYVRENVITGKNCVLGNSSEFKNCLLFDNVEAPHFNYVGDSILGYKAHLGAGVICSNVRLDRRNVQVRDREQGQVDTGLRKFGAIVGDRTEVGCNSVLSPGSLLGRDCIVYPCTHWQGILEAESIVKHKQPLEVVKRRGL